MTNVFITMQKLKIPFDFDTVLIGPLENYSIIVKYLCLSLQLVVLPKSIYLVTTSVGFW